MCRNSTAETLRRTQHEGLLGEVTPSRIAKHLRLHKVPGKIQKVILLESQVWNTRTRTVGNCCSGEGEAFHTDKPTRRAWERVGVGLIILDMMAE